MKLQRNPENVGMYMAWAVLKREPVWDLRGPYDSKEAAEYVRSLSNEGYEVVFGSWRAGTDEFILE